MVFHLKKEKFSFVLIISLNIRLTIGFTLLCLITFVYSTYAIFNVFRLIEK